MTVDANLKGLGERLLEARTDAKLSQTDVAEKMQMPKQSVSHWETGRQGLNVFDLKKVADLYGVSIDWLIAGGEKKKAA